MTTVRLLLVSLLLSPTFAQTFRTVDSAAGPFFTIQAAVNASLPRDVIVVVGNPGVVYAPFVSTIGINIQGLNDPVIAMGTVQNLPGGQTFSMECIAVQAPGLRVVDCQGTAHFEMIGPVCAAGPCSPPPALEVLRSTLVTGYECVFGENGGPAVHAEQCALSLTYCEARGTDATSAAPGTPAVRIVNARVAIGSGQYIGGNGSISQPPSPAIEMSVGELQCNGAQADLRGGLTGALAPAIVALTGVVRVDPRVSLQPSSQNITIGGGAAVSTPMIPFASIQVEGPGGSLVTTTQNFAGDGVIQAIGFPLPPLPIAPFGDLWLQPGAIATVGVGTADSQGRFVTVLSIPGSSALEGLVLGHQSLVLSGAVAALTNPAFGIITGCAITD